MAPQSDIFFGYDGYLGLLRFINIDKRAGSTRLYHLLQTVVQGVLMIMCRTGGCDFRP